MTKEQRHKELINQMKCDTRINAILAFVSLTLLITHLIHLTNHSK